MVSILLGLNVLHIVSIFVPVRDIPTLSYDSRILILICTLLQTSFLHIPYTHTAYVTKFLEPLST